MPEARTDREALIRDLRAATEDDVAKALEGAYIDAPAIAPELLEFYNLMLDVRCAWTPRLAALLRIEQAAQCVVFRICSNRLGRATMRRGPQHQRAEA